MLKKYFIIKKNVDVRTNWDVDETIDLSIPYNPEVEKKQRQKEKRRRKKRTAF